MNKILPYGLLLLAGTSAWACNKTPPAPAGSTSAPDGGAAPSAAPSASAAKESQTRTAVTVWGTEPRGTLAHDIRQGASWIVKSKYKASAIRTDSGSSAPYQAPETTVIFRLVAQRVDEKGRVDLTTTPLGADVIGMKEGQEDGRRALTALLMKLTSTVQLTRSGGLSGLNVQGGGDTPANLITQAFQPYWLTLQLLFAPFPAQDKVGMGAQWEVAGLALGDSMLHLKYSLVSEKPGGLLELKVSGDREEGVPSATAHGGRGSAAYVILARKNGPAQRVTGSSSIVIEGNGSDGKPLSTELRTEMNIEANEAMGP